MSNENPESNSFETPQEQLFAELVNAPDSEIQNCKFESKPYLGGHPHDFFNKPSYEWSSLKAQIKGHSVEFYTETIIVLEQPEGVKSSVVVDGVDLEGRYDHTAADALEDRLHKIAEKAE